MFLFCFVLILPFRNSYPGCSGESGKGALGLVFRLVLQLAAWNTLILRPVFTRPCNRQQPRGALLLLAWQHWGYHDCCWSWYFGLRPAIFEFYPQNQTVAGGLLPLVQIGTIHPRIWLFDLDYQGSKVWEREGSLSFCDEAPSSPLMHRCDMRMSYHNWCTEKQASLEVRKTSQTSLAFSDIC